MISKPKSDDSEALWYARKHARKLLKLQHLDANSFEGMITSPEPNLAIHVLEDVLFAAEHIEAKIPTTSKAS
jgi:hypothetical protein